ncbi:inositol monophosphatase family protein [Pelagibius marinus]|uniref:inositol monophosphatase family protein n=1 Tax=Pelagibius marinus TaxID=2762760 RepID=UPI00187314EA|nr:inositol monophosphatase [Pelagibius marinus]
MIDIARVSAVIEEIAATDVLPRFQALAAHEIEEKIAGELVTVVDVAVEKLLTARLRDLLPGSLVVGEEAVHLDPALMSQVTADAPVWIIDPIDGTRNFAHGREVFAIMVALVNNGENEAAWILEPVSGRFGVAERGSGAWMGERRLQVAAPDTPARMTGSLHASSYAPKELARLVDQRRNRVQAVKSLRCAGAEYLRLAAGEIHFSLFTRLMPWDHVPGTLLHQEAGGTALCFDGTPYTAGRYNDLGLLMAPDRASWDALHETLLAG